MSKKEIYKLILLVLSVLLTTVRALEEKERSITSRVEDEVV